MGFVTSKIAPRSVSSVGPRYSYASMPVFHQWAERRSVQNWQDCNLLGVMVSYRVFKNDP
jgi:hypothetical protein